MIECLFFQQSLIEIIYYYCYYFLSRWLFRNWSRQIIKKRDDESNGVTPLEFHRIAHSHSILQIWSYCHSILLIFFSFFFSLSVSLILYLYIYVSLLLSYSHIFFCAQSIFLFLLIRMTIVIQTTLLHWQNREDIE